jgi:hypothetical protein
MTLRCEGKPSKIFYVPLPLIASAALAVFFIAALKVFIAKREPREGWDHTVIFSFASARATAGRPTMRFLNAV